MYGQNVFAGDGDDYVSLGDGWGPTLAYGGSGNDTFNLPVNGASTMKVYGGDGNDIFDTDRDQLISTIVPDVKLFGGAGNDKITMLEFSPKQYGYGGTGDDKIIFYGTSAMIAIEGNDGDDIIYGTDGIGVAGGPRQQKIYGDESNTSITANADLAGVGGDDKIYGGSDMLSNFIYAGGPANDLISLGSNLTGTQ